MESNLNPKQTFNQIFSIASKKVRNNLYKLKNEITKIVYLLYQHNKISKNAIQQFNQVNKDNKLVIITKPRTIYFDLSKTFDNNLKHEIGFIIKYNQFLAEHTIKNQIVQLLFKLKHGNDIYEQWKQ